MRNDESGKLLDDLKSLSIELDNLSSFNGNKSKDPDAPKDSDMETLPLALDPQVDEDRLCEDHRHEDHPHKDHPHKDKDEPDLETMLETIVNEAMPELEQQLYEQLKLKSHDIIASLYRQSQNDTQ